ncbi:peptidase M24 family protein [Anaerobacillus arseniciselenatis]|uniref:Peptidase M24 family protein n=1 Tax=Anaerobacillus arseniciselenatis TaxID=85682 RepID=A0A1S2LEX5_9BACI|nr:Xaa-Pro peptidase family protein [Anaerobacillus arseniciselenatis]OIJ10941.1 peptidase M24 family protein [Anaerobacillus arseniciselenatis]
MNQRLTQLSNWLSEQNIDFAFVQTKANVFYLSGFYSEPHERLIGIFVFPNGEPVMVCPNMEKPQAKAAGWEYDIVSYSDSDNYWELIKNYLNKKGQGGQKIAIEEEHISYLRANALNKIYNEAKFVSVEEKLNSLRLIKDDQELALLKQAAELADFGVEVGVNAIKSGKTEMDILALIEYELKRKGIREMSFSTMVLTGAKTADPHGNPGITEINRGDFVLFDLGVVLDGYCSDITRTVAFQEINDEQRRIYETVLSAQNAAFSICKVGTRVGDIDKAARNYITEAGYGDYFPHRIGHGLGIDVHEFPSMSENNDDLLQEGAVFTVEPGIYVPNVGGVRIEDDIVITKDGFESLTKYPKGLTIV